MAPQKEKVRERDRRNIQGEKTRLIILDVSARLFAQRGYDNVSLRDIASEIDTVASLIIHHFGSKAALYRKTVRFLLGNGELFLRCALPVARADASDKQACANAIADCVHLFFDCWHGPNRIRYLDQLMLQVISGRGSVDAAQMLDWIGSAEHIIEDFFRRVTPSLSAEDADVQMEVFFGSIFYPAVIRKVLLFEHNWSDYPVATLLKWKKYVVHDICAGLDLPQPTYIFPEEKDPNYYKVRHKPEIETRREFQDRVATHSKHTPVRRQFDTDDTFDALSTEVPLQQPLEPPQPAPPPQPVPPAPSQIAEGADY